MRARRAAEQAAEEAQTRVNELTTININLASIKTKLEQELSIITADYDELSKELKVNVLYFVHYVELQLIFLYILVG